MSITDKLEQAKQSEHAQKSSEWFKFKEGENRIRILTEPVIFFEDFKLGICYTDCGFQGTMKGLAWIHDKADDKVKLMKLNFKLLNTLGEWENDEDYAFNGYPMPYDVSIKAKNAGTKEVEYTYLPKPKTAISEEVTAKTKEEKTPEEIVEKMKENNITKHKSDGTYDKLQEKVKEQKENYKEQAQAHNAKNEEEVIEYPEEEIDPSDIPF